MLKQLGLYTRSFELLRDLVKTYRFRVAFLPRFWEKEEAQFPCLQLTPQYFIGGLIHMGAH